MERLFAEKGVAGTSLPQLADAAGLPRTGIYHCIRSKDDLLTTLVEDFALRTARELRQLAASDEGSAVARLRAAVTGMALVFARHPQLFRLRPTSEGAFPGQPAKQYRRARRATLAVIEDLVPQAIKKDSCRLVDHELAAFSLAGVSDWSQPGIRGSAAPAPRVAAGPFDPPVLAGIDDHEAQERRAHSERIEQNLNDLAKKQNSVLQQAMDGDPPMPSPSPPQPLQRPRNPAHRPGRKAGHRDPGDHRRA
ncbi:MAG TPA: TetR/AcrR family transcriptional regulator [Streptosporangiaceae bacterium]